MEEWQRQTIELLLGGATLFCGLRFLLLLAQVGTRSLARLTVIHLEKQRSSILNSDGTLTPSLNESTSTSIPTLTEGSKSKSMN